MSKWTTIDSKFLSFVIRSKYNFTRIIRKPDKSF